jgi:tRNA threonylcarbamoyladenosine biosynthesis protein TsaB
LNWKEDMNLKDHVFLCMDSACGAGSVAVFVRGACVASVADEVSGTQAKNLIPMVEQALGEACVGYADLAAIVATIGPGSFTGIRIALSSARAYGLALQKPVVGVSTLACVANHHAGDALAILNAGKGEAFVQAFNAQMQPLDEPHMLPIAEIRAQFPNAHLVGQLSLLGAGESTLPNAKMAGELLLAHPEFAVAPEPLYIRAPDAKLPTA